MSDMTIPVILIFSDPAYYQLIARIMFASLTE